ncbi:DIT1 [Candida margitis]|uniref:DIT1 n=1 Tax=Candida margitis TaxID=1775924 RepID=UPI00222644D0|nr:DIT1 [Candida margitis]KAI5968302.1 DIT1 [Candida margitis]
MESVSTLSLNSSASSSTTIDGACPPTIYENVCMIYSRDNNKILSYRNFNKFSVDLTDAIFSAKYFQYKDGFSQAVIDDRFFVWEKQTGETLQGVVTLQISITDFVLWFINLLITSSQVSFSNTKDLSHLSDTVTNTFAEKLKHTVERDMWDAIGREKFKKNVEFFTSRGQPLEAVLPAFPCKSSNYEKVSGDLPDKGEELALRRLIFFADEVQKIYPPGIIIWIVSDGHVFSDCIAVDDTKVNRYSAALKQMYKRVKPVDSCPIKFCSLPEIFKFSKELPAMVENVNLGHFLGTKIDPESEVCRKILMSSCDTDNGKLRGDIKTPGHARLYLFRGFSKFMTEDLQFHPRVGKMTRKKFKKIVSQVAHEMIKRNDAYSNLVELMFPFHLRFSIHAHNNAGPKYGVSLLSKNGTEECLPIESIQDHKEPRCTDLLHIPTPWHNAIVRINDDETYYVIKAAKVVQDLGDGTGSGGWDPKSLHYVFSTN